jgi:DnaK suppressor protein
MKNVSASTVVQSTRPGLRQIGDRWPLSPANPKRQARVTPIRRVQSPNTQTIDLKEYRQRLLNRKAELASGLHSRPGMLAELGHVAEEDQAPVIHSEFIAVRINQISHEQLDLVEAALARLDSGEYGICVECERPIAAKRLAAVPWASHCVACQERLDPLERTQT